MKEVNNEKIVLASAFRRQVRPPQWWNPMDISRYTNRNAGLVEETRKVSRFDVKTFFWPTATVFLCVFAIYTFLELMDASKEHFFFVSLPVCGFFLVADLVLYTAAIRECRNFWNGTKAASAREELAAMTDDELNARLIEPEIEKAKEKATGYGSKIYALRARLANRHIKVRETISNLELRLLGTNVSNEEREYLTLELAARKRELEVLSRDFDRVSQEMSAARGAFNCLSHRIRLDWLENLLKYVAEDFPVEECDEYSEIDVQLTEGLVMAKSELVNLAERINGSFAAEEDEKD